MAIDTNKLLEIKTYVDKFNFFRKQSDYYVDLLGYNSNNEEIQSEFVVNDNDDYDLESVDGIVYNKKTSELRQLLYEEFSNVGYDISKPFISALVESFYVVDTNMNDAEIGLYDMNFYEDRVHNDIKIISTFTNEEIDLSYRLKNQPDRVFDDKFYSYDLMNIMDAGHSKITLIANYSERGYLAIGKHPYDPDDKNNTIFYPLDETGKASIEIPEKNGVRIFSICKDFLENNVYHDAILMQYNLITAHYYYALMNESLSIIGNVNNTIMEKLNILFKMLSKLKIFKRK